MSTCSFGGENWALIAAEEETALAQLNCPADSPTLLWSGDLQQSLVRFLAATPVVPVTAPVFVPSSSSAAPPSPIAPEVSAALAAAAASNEVTASASNSTTALVNAGPGPVLAAAQRVRYRSLVGEVAVRGILLRAFALTAEADVNHRRGGGAGDASLAALAPRAGEKFAAALFKLLPQVQITSSSPVAPASAAATAAVSGVAMSVTDVSALTVQALRALAALVAWRPSLPAASPAVFASPVHLEALLSLHWAAEDAASGHATTQAGGGSGTTEGTTTTTSTSTPTTTLGPAPVAGGFAVDARSSACALAATLLREPAAATALATRPAALDRIFAAVLGSRSRGGAEAALSLVGAVCAGSAAAADALLEKGLLAALLALLVAPIDDVSPRAREMATEVKFKKLFSEPKKIFKSLHRFLIVSLGCVFQIMGALASEGPQASAVAGALALFLPAPFLARLLVTRPSGSSQAAAVVALLAAHHATPEVPFSSFFKKRSSQSYHTSNSLAAFSFFFFRHFLLSLDLSPTKQIYCIGAFF